MEKSNIPEEVTITPVIRDIERLFLRLFAFIRSSLIYLARLFLKIIQLIMKYFLVLILVTIVGGVLGYYSERFSPRDYTSTMLVQPSINAKSQLYNDVNYINSLIKKGETETLSNLFEITVEEAQSLGGMAVIPITTEMDKMRYIVDLYKNLDSSMRSGFDFSMILKEKDETFANRFKIDIYGTNPTVFSKLSPKFLEFLERVPELQRRRKAGIALLEQQKQFYLKQLNDLDTLKKVMNISKLYEARKVGTSASTSISLGSQKTQETSNTLDVYDQSSRFFNEIISIEGSLFDLTSCYKVYAKFSEYGIHRGSGKLRRAALAGGSLFGLTLIILGIASILGSLRKRDA